MKVGLIFAHSGLAGLWTPGCHGGAILAATGINAAGGVLGQEIELVTIDSGETRQSARLAAQRLAIDERVDAVIGLQASHLRPAVRDGLAGLAPYIYTSNYEGGVCGPGLAPLGITDSATLPPILEWFAHHRAARRVFFLGSNYVWPRVTCGLTEAAAEVQGRFVGQMFLPLGHRNYDQALDAIRAARADLVVHCLLGEDAVAFNRAFGEAGLSHRIQRLAMAFDEVQLLAIGPENAENLFAVQAYFDTRCGRARHAMMDDYDSSFAGQRPGVTANAASCYDAVRVVAALAQRLGRPDGHLMARALGRQTRREDMFALIGCDRAPSARLAEADGTVFRVIDSV